MLVPIEMNSILYNMFCSYHCGVHHVIPLHALNLNPWGVKKKAFEAALERKETRKSSDLLWSHDDKDLCSCFCFVDRARALSCPGWDLKGVKLLQTHDDANEIHTSCQGQNAVIIGASFIGYYLYKKNPNIRIDLDEHTLCFDIVLWNSKYA